MLNNQKLIFRIHNRQTINYDSQELIFNAVVELCLQEAIQSISIIILRLETATMYKIYIYLCNYVY